MQNKQWNTKQFLGMIALFLVMEWGMVAWFTMDNGVGDKQAQDEDDYVALERAMTVEASDNLGDYYDLELVMTVPDVEETGE